MQTQSDSAAIQQVAEAQNPLYYYSDTKIAQRYGVTRQTVWRWAATDPTFPRPTKLSPGCTRWKLSDIEAWEAGKGGAK